MENVNWRMPLVIALLLAAAIGIWWQKKPQTPLGDFGVRPVVTDSPTALISGSSVTP